jgi:hypothetical protein
MLNVLKFIVLLALALTIGGFANGALVSLSPYLIPPPEGLDLSTPEGLTAAAPLMEPKHFVIPWLAHALGTLVGALLISWWQPKWSLWGVLVVGLMFFIGGVMMVQMVPAPIWFVLADLGLAYFPMAFLGRWMVRRLIVIKSE